MSNNVQVRYDNKDIGSISSSDIQYVTVPFVEISSTPIRLEKNWGKSENIKLTGQIVFKECNPTVSSMISGLNHFSSFFSKDFKEFKVVDGSGAFARGRVRVISVSFGDSSSSKIKDYIVELSCDNSMPEGNFNVLNPSKKIEYKQNDDGTIGVDIRVSAESSTNSNLLDVIDYVNDQLSLSDFIQPSTRISEFDAKKAILKSKTEDLNRVDGSYSVSLSYIMPKIGNIPFFLQQSYTINYNEEIGIYECSMNGSISAGIDADFSSVRDAFNSLNPYNLCRSRLMGLNADPAPPGLNPNPVSMSIEENESENSITFSFSYDSDISFGEASFEYDSTVSYDDSSSLYSCSVSGFIYSRLSQKDGWDKVKALVNGINLKGICQKELNDEVGGKQLDDDPENLTYAYNEREAKIDISCTFKEKGENPLPNFKDLTYTIEIQRPIAHKAVTPTITDGVKIVNINAKKRGSVSISGSAKTRSKCPTGDLTSAIRGFITSKVDSYLSGDRGAFLESISITKEEGVDGHSYSFQMTKSYFGDLYEYSQ